MSEETEFQSTLQRFDQTLRNMSVDPEQADAILRAIAVNTVLVSSPEVQDRVNQNPLVEVPSWFAAAVGIASEDGEFTPASFVKKLMKAGLADQMAKISSNPLAKKFGGVTSFLTSTKLSKKANDYYKMILPQRSEIQARARQYKRDFQDILDNPLEYFSEPERLTTIDFGGDL